jgi:MSHA pilin protein MshA
MQMRSVSGFTLIELVAVIAILAILAATAIPKFLDLRVEAVRATANGVAGALASATAVNYAARVSNSAATNGTVVNTCTTSANTLVGNALPAGAVFVNPATGVTNGATTGCTIAFTGGGTTISVTATIIGAT